MPANSKIEWTGRSDWNPVRGCTRISPGCGGPGPHGGCYAEAIAGRFSGEGQPFHGFADRTSKGGRWTGKVELMEERLTLPMHWSKPATIFASSTSDIFHESLSDADIDRIFAVMALTPQHTYQILTKRADRMRDYVSQLDEFALVDTEEFREAQYRVDCDDDDNGSAAWHAQTAALEKAIIGARTTLGKGRPLPNVWLGVSVENQEWADRRREDLSATPAAVHFVSYEPALGPVDWSGWEFVDQIIGGGESGPRARPMHPDWQRATRDFCAQHEIAYFFKQWGEWAPRQWKADGGTHAMHCLRPDSFQKLGHPPNSLERTSADPEWQAFARVGKKAAGRLLDGVQHDGVPA
jgi:protein gp37